MSRRAEGGNRLVIGGPPRADLLPPEVGERARARRARGTAVTLIVGSVIVAIVGSGAATFFAIDSAIKLEVANERTQQILIEQGQYHEVRQVTQLIGTAKAARAVSTATEIGWKKYLADIQASLPAGTVVTNVTADTATPLLDFGQPSVPLQGARMGVLDFTAISPSLPDIEKWLSGLSTLPGYVDAAPRSVTLNEEDGTYTVSITMHIDQGALLGRYAEERQGWADIDAEAKAPAAPEPEEEADADGDNAEEAGNEEADNEEDGE